MLLDMRITSKPINRPNNHICCTLLCSNSIPGINTQAEIIALACSRGLIITVSVVGFKTQGIHIVFKSVLWETSEIVIFRFLKGSHAKYVNGLQMRNAVA